jgi:hypothetical protein
VQKKLAEMKTAKEDAEAQASTSRAYIATSEDLLAQKDASIKIHRQHVVVM